MTHNDNIPPNEVHIRVARDEDASRISAVLEALGYTVLRQLDEGDGPARLRWAVNRLARRHKLTSREQDILELVLHGSTNLQIGEKLEISRATVKWHMHNIFAKTNTGNREALLRLALQLGGGGDPVVEPIVKPAGRSAGGSTSSEGSSGSGGGSSNEGGSSTSASSGVAKPTVSAPPRSSSGGYWAGAEEVTARIEFDQPRVPSADSVPSKSYF